MSAAPFAFLEKNAPGKQEKPPVATPAPAAEAQEHAWAGLQQLQGQVGLLDHLIRSTAAYHDERLRMVILIMWLLVALNVVLVFCIWCFSGRSASPALPTYAPPAPPAPTWWMPPPGGYPRS